MESKYPDRFYKKSIQGREGNIFTRLEALESLVQRLQLKDTTTVVNQIITQGIEFISTSVAGGTNDPTDPAFTGIILSKSGQHVNGVLYHFALVIDGVVFTGMGDDGAGGVTVSGLNIDASSNIAILSAISSLMTGNNNVAIGQDVLEDNTSGVDNVGIGQNALLENTSGGENVAIGINALSANTSGLYNVAIGANALDDLEDGDDNTAIGDRALSTLIYGSGNIAIGKYAGVHETDISNRLFVDNRNRGSESAGRTEALIYGVFDDDPANQELHFNANVDVNGNFTVNGLPVSGGADLAAIRKSISIGY